MNEPHGQKTDGQIDQEDPPPRRIVGKPTAQGRPNRGGTDCGNSVDGKCQAALLPRKGILQNRLRHRLQTSASGTLKHPEQYIKSETGAVPADLVTSVKINHYAMKKHLTP